MALQREICIMAQQELLPDDLRGKIPALYAQQHARDHMVYAKLFTPDTQWTWFILEFDGRDECFGYEIGDVAEGLTYFSLSALQAIRGPLGLSVERDEYFVPKPLSEAKRERAGQRHTGE